MDKKALERELERRMTQINRWIERDLPHPAPGTGSSTKERTARRCPTSSHCISFDSYIKPQLPSRRHPCAYFNSIKRRLRL